MQCNVCMCVCMYIYIYTSIYSYNIFIIFHLSQPQPRPLSHPPRHVVEEHRRLQTEQLIRTPVFDGQGVAREPWGRTQPGWKVRKKCPPKNPQVVQVCRKKLAFSCCFVMFYDVLCFLVMFMLFYVFLVMFHIIFCCSTPCRHCHFHVCFGTSTVHLEVGKVIAMRSLFARRVGNWSRL